MQVPSRVTLGPNPRLQVGLSFSCFIFVSRQKLGGPGSLNRLNLRFLRHCLRVEWVSFCFLPWTDRGTARFVNSSAGAQVCLCHQAIKQYNLVPYQPGTSPMAMML